MDLLSCVSLKEKETSRSCIPELALNPLGQIMPHLDGEMLAVQRLHLVQRLTLQLLGLDPHCHGAPVKAEAWQRRTEEAETNMMKE